MICPKCGVENVPNARFCEQCGNPLKSITKERKRTNVKKAVIISVVLIFLAVVAACAFFFLGHTQDEEDKYYNSYTENISYYSDGTSKMTYTKYREDNQPLEELLYDGDILKFNYDEYGKLIQLIFSDDASGNSETIEFVYSNTGNQQIGTATVHSSNQEEGTIELYYDRDNHLQEFLLSDGASTVSRKLYDQNGNLIESFSNGSLTTTEYNEYGNELYSKTVNSSDSVTETKTQYDKDGQTLMKQETYRNGSLTYITVVTEDTRDEEGGVVKRETHDGSGVYQGYTLINYRDGVQTKIEAYDANDDLQARWMFDEYGHMTHYTAYHKGNITYESVSYWTLKESYK